MKLKYKILIGTLVIASLSGVIASVAINIPADGIHNGVGLNGVIYKTNQSQQQDSIKEQINENHSNLPLDQSNTTILDPETPEKEEHTKQENKEIIKQDNEQLLSPILAEEPIKPFVLPEIIQEEVKTAGFQVKAKISNQPERIEFLSDQNEMISNPDQYIANQVPNVVALELTDQFSKYTANKVTSEFKESFSSLAQALKILNGSDLTNFLAKNPSYWERLFSRFADLFNSPNIKNFLTIEGQAKFQEFVKLSNLERYAKYFAYLDVTKLNELSDDAKAKLKKGEVLEPRNLYVDSKGRLNSTTFSPLPGFNKVISRLEYENKNKRIFRLKDTYHRKPDNILKGEYDGWTKRDVTKQYIDNGIKIYDGVSIATLTDQTQEPIKKEDKVVVSFDFTNQQTKSKAKEVLESLKENNQSITGYRFINISSSTEDQKALKEALENLPEKIPFLELIFTNPSTAALAVLENKKITELSLYTTDKTPIVDFPINPLYLRNVSWINTNEVSNQTAYNQDYPGKIVFNTISFNQNDIEISNQKYNNPLTRINQGLRMAYWVRNNEPFFQGIKGAGAYPDHNEFSNGYPTNLDLSQTNLKSLLGLEFDDKKKLSNGFRQLHSLKLANNSSIYSLSADEMNNSQYAKIMNLNPNLTKPAVITFSNGIETKTIQITTKNANEVLSADGLDNLRALQKVAKTNFNDTPILISKGSVALIKQLQDNHIAFVQE